MHNIIYYSLHALGVIVSVVYVLHFARKYNLEGKKHQFDCDGLCINGDTGIREKRQLK